MSGLSSAQSRIRNLGKQSVKVEQGKKVSVVYINPDGTIDWPQNCNDGVLVIPRPVGIDEWQQQCTSRAML